MGAKYINDRQQTEPEHSVRQRQLKTSFMYRKKYKKTLFGCLDSSVHDVLVVSSSLFFFLLGTHGANFAFCHVRVVSDMFRFTILMNTIHKFLAFPDVVEVTLQRPLYDFTRAQLTHFCWQYHEVALGSFHMMIPHVVGIAQHISSA